MTPSPNNEPRTASAPFDSTDADTILRTTDLVDFRTHTAILTLCSTVFREELTAAAHTSAPADSPRVMTVQVNSSDLDTVLRLCYPFTAQPDDLIDDLTELDNALTVARQLGMEGLVTQCLGPALLEHAPHARERVYALAWAHELGDVVHEAALETLYAPEILYTNQPDFTRIPASAMVELLVFRRACSQAASSLCQDLRWVSTTHYAVANCKGTCTKDVVTLQGGQAAYVCCWWNKYMQLAGEVLKHTPRGSAVTSSCLMREPFEAANKCPMCTKTGYENTLEAMSQTLSEKVEQVIREIKLETPF